MGKIERIEEFKRFFLELFQKKRTELSHEVDLPLKKDIMGRHGSRYKNNGGPVRISSVEQDGKMIILDDGSQWSAVPGLGLDQNHAVCWSRMERISLKGSGSSNIYTLSNLDMGESSRWVFQGYIETGSES